jgi:hypothetical protein
MYTVGIFDGMICYRLKVWWKKGKFTQGKGSCLNEDEYLILVPTSLENGKILVEMTSKVN